MRRPSIRIQDLVSNMDSLAGKAHSISESEEMEFGMDHLFLKHIVTDVALVCAEEVLTGCAQVLEYCIERPLYHAENLVLGKSENRPCFIYR